MHFGQAQAASAASFLQSSKALAVDGSNLPFDKNPQVDGCFLWNCVKHCKAEFATHKLKSYQPSHRTMVLKGSSLYVSAALVPQNASKFYAEWSSHALFVLFQAL